MKDLLYLKDDHLKEFIEKLFVCYKESFNDVRKTCEFTHIIIPSTEVHCDLSFGTQCGTTL